MSLTPQQNYEQLPEHVYPINLLTLKGSYPIKLTYTDIGRTDRQVKNNGTYTCVYEVENEIISLPEGPGGGGGNDDGPRPGLNLFFRPIDLNNMFPTTRQKGANWNTTEANNIKNAIERLGNDVWLQRAEYKFTLTPTNIEKIKLYNDEKERANVGYLDMSLNCERGIKNCYSGFLTNIMTNGHASKSDICVGRGGC